MPKNSYFKITTSILLVCLFVSNSIAQGYNRKNRDLVTFNGQYKMGGWLVSPGITYMWPNKIKFLGGQEDPNIKAHGRIGLYLEAGRYRFFYDGGRYFNYFDYSLAYKRLSGSEEYLGNKGLFKQNYLLGNFNVNNIWQLTDFTFIQNSIGVNLDYKFLEKYENSGSPLGANTDKLLFSLHYKIGYGMKVTETLFIIPSIETPIINVKKWEKFKSTYGLFSSRYRPLILSVRFAWLRRPGKGACPPVYANPDDKAKQEQYMMGQ